ncbi:helix-turn-helix protein [Amycolatopsis echigonensis]|uniref:Helix-turn-helix protein n=1 Tax=Amycolatopsis echigonensis TaxID=2576905 RepID=A0A2N3X1Z9_9PSEU|nr:helix-turn-helix domain-containing protein [Amycolatopsis niigatensis]PKW00130.1 helix-turn-helix protein [Amycolatopsis niigatensis]
MSIEAINWALRDAPIPDDRRDSSSLAIVLIGLANHADPDGRNAFPSLATLARYTRLSERSVRYALRHLQHLGLIAPADPGIVAAHVRRADRRPNGYDLSMTTEPRQTASDDLPPTDRGQRLPPVSRHEGQNTTARAANNAAARGKHCPRNIPKPSMNRPNPRTNLRSEPIRPVPPPCGQCDARPGDPIGTRSTTDCDGNVRRCPLCHPAEIQRRDAECGPADDLVNHSSARRSRVARVVNASTADRGKRPPSVTSVPIGGPYGQP